jgi:hypothetical protein
VVFFKPAMEIIEYLDYTKTFSFQILSYHQCCVVLDSASDMEIPHCSMREKWGVLQRSGSCRW